jgi:hypothetical protein
MGPQTEEALKMISRTYFILFCKFENANNMAQKIKMDSIFDGLSGKVGNVVFYQTRTSKTMIRSMPTIKSKPTQRQKSHHNRFSMASAYAKHVLENPEIQAFYQKNAKPGMTAYNAAVADYLCRPTVEQIISDDYTGHAGDHIWRNCNPFFLY